MVGQDPGKYHLPLLCLLTHSPGEDASRRALAGEIPLLFA